MGSTMFRTVEIQTKEGKEEEKDFFPWIITGEGD
jgi:hypothetical protein